MMRHELPSNLINSRLSNLWTMLLLAVFCTGGVTLGAQPLFGDDPAPAKIAHETVNLLRASQSNEDLFEITIFSPEKLVDLHAGLNHRGTPSVLQNLLIRNYLCNPFHERYYFTSLFTKYISPEVVITSLLNEMVAQHYMVACSFDAGLALGHAETIERLSHVRNQVTNLRCLYKLEE